ncbi:MAG: hypothetical protein AAGH68_05315 [Pseudomonadota bacterium]
MTRRPEALTDRTLDNVVGGGTTSYQALPELDANGALGRGKASDAYFVKVDSETTTQAAEEPKKTSTVRAVQIMK